MSGSRSVAAQHICVGSGSAFLNRNPQCLGTAKADVFYGHLCLSTLNTFQTPSLQAHLEKLLRCKPCSSSKLGVTALSCPLQELRKIENRHVQDAVIDSMGKG